MNQNYKLSNNLTGGGLMFFWRRLLASFGLMTKKERLLSLVLVCLALFLAGYKYYSNYKSDTVLVPAAGGEYREAIVGELKYLNPVLAQSGADKISSGLIFSGLVKTSKSGVQPDVADHWEVSPDGLRYTFYLKKNVQFHDGTKLTAGDVAYTIESIKAYESKSLLYDAWRDVKISVADDYTVIFELPRPYGPFIYNCDFGILPSYLSSDDLAKKFIGSGPYRFVSSKAENHKTVELRLARDESYYLEKPYLSKIDLAFFDSADKAKEAFLKDKYDAVFGMETEKADTNNLTYETAKRFGLIFNLRNDRLKDKEFRRKIVENVPFVEKTKLRMIALDMAPQRAQAEVIKQKLAEANVELEVIYLNAVQMRDVLDSKEFETLLYGFDFGYDRDSYSFWHSSQMDKRNYAGYSDKATDILLEDARMMLDPVERNKKYDEFFGKLQQEYLIKFYEPMKYNLYISQKIKGTKPIDGVEPDSQFNDFVHWYVKEKRVRK